MAWPSIAAPTYTTGGEIYLSIIRTEFEGGYVQSRAKATRFTRRWTLVWVALSEAHYQTLEAYFISMRTTDTWTEPITLASYTFRFAEGSLKWNHSALGHRTVTVGIETI